jgi:MIZ/SP-RING zinc finger
VNPHGATVNHIISSNSTTQHFLGAPQRGWMTGLGGNNTSLLSSSPVRPVAASRTGTSAPEILLQDPTTARPATQRPATQPPNGIQASQSGHTQASSMRWAMVITPQPASARKRSFEAAFVQPATPVTSPLEQRQQSPPGPPPGPPTTIATSPSLSSSHGITMEPLPRLNAFLDQIRFRGHLNDLVSCRASILRDALIYQDTFYLCLHQIFCRATADPLFTMQIGFGDEQFRGLDTIQAILFSNGGLPPDVLHFFATFPYPDPTNASPMPGQVVAQVRALLSDLVGELQGLRQTCIRRGYPPFTDESRARLRLDSPVFQKVLFNSIHRQLTGTGSPVWVEQGLRLFDENLRISQERLAVTGYPLSDQQVEAEARQLGAQYLSLRSKLQRARVEASSTSSGLPADTDNQVVQHSSLTGPGTGAFSHHTLRRHNGGVQAWLTDAPPPRVQELFNQSLPRVDHIQQSQMQHQDPVTDQQQHSSQSATNLGNRVQQMQPSRRGRPPLSYNRQVSRPTASHALPSSAITTSNPTTNMTSDGGRRVTATGPPAVPNSNRNSNTLDTPYPPLLPPLGLEPIQGINQNYRIVALHQAYLRSPKYQVSNVQGTINPIQRLYQVPTGCILSPQVLGHSCPYFSWQFDLSATHLQWRAKDLLFLPDPRNPSLSEPVRQVTSGSSLYRLKCIEVPANTISISMPEHVWVTRETVWPTGIFLAINDKELEVRRKLHHGKDLTIDLTMYVKEGLNTVTCSLLRTTEEMKLGKNFAVAVEVVEIISDERIKGLPILLKEADAKNVITKSLNSGLHSKSDGTDNDKDKDEDEEIQVVDAHISIDITDPYTARIFEMPVRGKTCLHRECFDLQTFLDTRKARTRDRDREMVPTSPDDWKCPVCKKDARPQNLVVDGFLQHVRKELGERDQLDVKAIRVQADGSWEPVLETSKVDRRGSANTDEGGRGAASRKQIATEPGAGVAPERWMGQRQGEAVIGHSHSHGQGQGQGKSEMVVIELD